jgi:Zn-dependent oligopeptidase
MEHISLPFNYTISQIKNVEKKIIITEKKWINYVKNNNLDPISFLNSYLYKLEKFNYIHNILTFLQYVSEKESIREESRKHELRLKKFFMKFYESKENYELFLILKTIKIESNDDVDGIRKLIKKILRSFEDNGVHLELRKKIVYDNIIKKLILLENNFSKNIANGIKKIKYTANELEGIDKNVLKSHEFRNNYYIFDTTYPDEQMILKNSIIENSRKKMFYAFHSVGGVKNLENLKNIVNYRYKISKIFGFENTVDYYLSYNRLASTKKINLLLKNITPILKKKANSEYNLLLIFSGKKELYDYDIAYYTTLYKKKYLDLDNELIKTYFPSNYTIPKILEIYGKLFNIKFEIDIKSNLGKWNKDVVLYKILDLLNKNDIKGYIYFDLYPRDGKYTHAATFDLQSTYKNENGHRVIPITAIVCNFTLPNDNEKYSLLSFNEVTTFCHELGHGLHNILSNAKYELLAGISNEKDFVEMPSQFFENWCWKRDFLKNISFHCESGKRLPTKIIDSIIKNKNSFNGIQLLIQILYLKYDIEIHQKGLVNNKFLKDKWFIISNELLPYKSSINTYPMSRFYHLNGYECGYYSYLWSLIYSYDAFSLFEKKGLFNKKLGLRFRKTILEAGSILGGEEILENFLGRKTNDKSFLNNLK